MAEKVENGVVDCGDRLLIVTRPLFSDDIPRHFVGIVDRASPHAILIHGYAFVRDGGESGYVRCKGQRSRVFPLDNQIAISVLPDDVDIERVRYERGQANQLVVTDGKQFRIDVREFAEEPSAS